MKLGDKAQDFTLKNVDGRSHSLSQYEAEALVIIFTCNHCPYAQAYDNRIKALAKDYKGQAQFVLINSNDARAYPEDSYDEMVRAAEAKEFDFPYLHDEAQEIAKAFAAECTPHAFVLDNQLVLRYEGRIDDNWREEDLALELNLRDAIESVLSGDEPSPSSTSPMGCSIKWK